MTGRLEKWCCIKADDKNLTLPAAMQKVAEVMEKIVHGRQPLFFLDSVTGTWLHFLSFIAFWSFSSGFRLLCYRPAFLDRSGYLHIPQFFWVRLFRKKHINLRIINSIVWFSVRTGEKRFCVFSLFVVQIWFHHSWSILDAVERKVKKLEACCFINTPC